LDILFCIRIRAVGRNLMGVFIPMGWAAAHPNIRTRGIIGNKGSSGPGLKPGAWVMNDISDIHQLAQRYMQSSCGNRTSTM